MVFRNTETGQEGSLKQLLPNVSSPQNLSTKELLDLNIVKVEVQPVEKTIEQIKSLKENEIKFTYDEIRKEGFLTSIGIKFDFDDESLNNYTQAFILIREINMAEIDIIDYDNVTHTVTFEQLKTALTEMGAKKVELLHVRRMFKNMILEATTKEEVEAIYWRKQILNEETMEVTGYNYNPILGGN